jgi:hypothetical protein
MGLWILPGQIMTNDSCWGSVIEVSSNMGDLTGGDFLLPELPGFGPSFHQFE